MFDAALLESRKDRHLGERKKSLPLAIALHAAALTAVVGAALWNTGEPPEPVIPIVFLPPAAPPPPLGTGGNHATETRRVVRPHPAIAPPSEIRDVAPTAPEPDAPTSGGPPFEGPDKDGTPGDVFGKPGGTGDLPVVGGEPRSADGPIEIRGDVKAPALVSMVEPEYPESMRRLHKEGVVILEAVITASGEVDDVRILKSEGAVLDRAASDAVRRWRYRAATLNGRAVSVYLTVTVHFGLNS
jgi:protein TonB